MIEFGMTLGAEAEIPQISRQRRSAAWPPQHKDFFPCVALRAGAARAEDPGKGGATKWKLDLPPPIASARERGETSLGEAESGVWESEMPKRVIDFDALWGSDKLASCAEWAQSEYAWLYGLADASGSFELTNLRVIWGRVAAIRKNLSLERLREIFDEFVARGLLFTWEENGKRYGHWTGSDIPGRLPARSWRVRLQKLAPAVPAEALAAYSARFGGSKEGIVLRAGANAESFEDRGEVERGDAEGRVLKHDLEDAQAQDWDLDSEGDLDLEKQVCLAPQQAQNRRPSGTPLQEFDTTSTAAKTGGRTREIRAASIGVRENMAPAAADRPGEISAAESAAKRAAQELLEIYESERGDLPAAGVLTAERRRRCVRWLAGGFTPEEFRAAVRCAAATPFLAGDGNRGWRASFDWLIANRTNARKVLEGEYAPQSSGPTASTRARGAKSRAERHVPADLYTGIGPRAAECGVRVNPAALERIRARASSCRKNAVPFSTTPRNPGFAEGTAFFGSTTTEQPGGSERVPARVGTEPQKTPPTPTAFDAHSRASPVLLKS